MQKTFCITSHQVGNITGFNGSVYNVHGTVNDFFFNSKLTQWHSLKKWFGLKTVSNNQMDRNEWMIWKWKSAIEFIENSWRILFRITSFSGSSEFFRFKSRKINCWYEFVSYRWFPANTHIRTQSGLHIWSMFTFAFFGDKSPAANSPIHGYLRTKVRELIRVLSRRRNCYIHDVDEFRTTKLCSLCFRTLG